MREKSKNILIALQLFTVLTGVAGCIFSFSEKKEEEKKPEIISVSISKGEIIETRDIIITWHGSDVSESYQYTLDETVSDWTESTYVVLTDLEDADHLFTIRARKDSVFSALTTINFIVDAIQGPGIVFTPRTITERTFIAIKLEDVNNLMAAHIEIFCVNNCANIINFTEREGLPDSVTTIYLADYNNPKRLIIDVGFAGAPQGIQGSPVLGSFFVSPLKDSGTIVIDPEKTEFRDVNNNAIEIQFLDMARIEK